MKIKPTKHKIVKDLRHGVVSFTFEKADGTDREMTATLLNKYIPEKDIPQYDRNAVTQHPRQPGVKVAQNPDLVVCYDIDKKGWRSFKISTLKEYRGIVGG